MDPAHPHGLFRQEGCMNWKYLFTSVEGRINRAKFWIGVLVLIAIAIVAFIIDMVAGTQEALGGIGLFSALATLVSIYFGICLYAKRWHDRDKSGWWTLITLVPVIGSIWILIELGMLEGTRGANRYGADPLG
jgi:uncharacterized membrane protein YhaH (DUF805 family)